MTESSCRIAVSIIAGGESYHDGDLDRLIGSLAGKVDGVYIAWNGTGNGPDATALSQKFGGEVVVASTVWEDDFSKARNFALDMIPRDQYDWMLWLDVDDTLEGTESPKEMLSGVKDTTSGVFLRYDYGTDDITGITLVEQWRERFMRTSNTWQWKWPVHETCHGAPGTVYTRRETVWIRHHRRPEDSGVKTRERNRRIISKARKQQPDEPRFDFYLGNELFGEAHEAKDDPDRQAEAVNAAVQLYKRFIERTEWDDDAYTANTRMAELLRMIGNHNSAVDAELQGLKIYPTWPNAYSGIAQSFMDLHEWEKAKFWLDVGLQYACKPVTSQIVEPLMVEYIPRVLRAHCLEKLERWDEAIKDLQAALKIRDVPELRERIKAFRKAKKAKPEMTKIVETLQVTKPSGRKPSVAFVTRPLFEPWHPLLEKERGAGGAETCIMRLAPRLAELGWEVFVFGTPTGHAGEYEGVQWNFSQDYDVKDSFDVLVSSRAPEVFSGICGSKVKALWMHDVNVGPQAFDSEWGDLRQRIDRIVALTGWHARHLDHLYGVRKSLQVIPNGAETRNFDHWRSVQKDPNRFVWTSSPDRGLDVVLQMWPEIRKMNDKAELHVYYGFESIDKIIAVAPDAPMARYLASFKAGIMDLAENCEGIVWHGRIPQADLAEELMKSSYWTYPTYFMETFCISALEAQLAGVIPITSPVAALQETVGPVARKFQVDGWPNNETFHRQYLKMVDHVLNLGEDETDRVSRACHDFALNYDWDQIAGVWDRSLRDWTR